jgi:hypothetical protein
MKPSINWMKMPINWMKFAESMAATNPYGPIVLADGSIYSPDGRRLVAPREDTA